ncbi:MAG TPA: MFS transporter [Thermoanaerobaculia bacterium]|jgi:MFS family permease|nr:MFS transporter [Thermoanaerobaculia bacterium]
MKETGATQPGGLGFMLRALRHPNYRLFFAGQTVSLVGTWMTRIATSWLVYRLTGSALLLGLVGFAGQIPSFLLAPFAGVLVDRWNRHRLLVVTQILAMLQSAALAGLTLAGVINIWHVLALSLCQGLINAFDMPARQAFVVEMVEKREDLPNAIALNSSMVNAARLLGPSLGGVIIAAVGEGWCFALDAASYVAVIASLLLMHLALRQRRAVGRETKVLHELREGWAYVVGSPAIRSILLLLALVSLVGMPYTVLMPVFASKILGGGPHTLGFLMAATGVGALSGAVFLANRRSVLGLGRVIPLMSGLFGAGLIGFSLSRSLWLSLPLLVATGLGFMVQMAASNTLLQTLVDDDKRGRVMSFYTMSIMGITPFGSLLAGGLASRIGAPHTLLFCGAGCILAALWFASLLPRLRERVRPIYIEKGILPAMAAEGISAATQLTVPPER